MKHCILKRKQNVIPSQAFSTIIRGTESAGPENAASFEIKVSKRFVSLSLKSAAAGSGDRH